jgi:ABC-2 type transport system ATP-binding protein
MDVQVSRYGERMTAPQNAHAERSEGGVVVRNARRSFGEVHAVRDASLDARPGTVTALIGPNGSGKTTLLLMLASLLRPDAGSIRVCGVDPSIDPLAVRASLGWMPDILGSWSVLTVRSALETTGRLYRMDRRTAAARASELLDLVGLTALAEQRTGVLSRGQKQKLSLARALVHDPSVLLLDEPASGLDPVARLDLQRLVRRLASDGKTILVSSHVLAELDEMADDAVYLEAGVTASADRVAKSKSSSREWRIRSRDLAGLRRSLAALGIDPARIVEDRGEILVPLDDEAAAEAMLRSLVTSGAPITAFSPAVGELEHTFLDLSRGGAVADPPADGARS